ncbi:MAG: hypothetical protein IKS74_03235 [Methanomicrobium sp.]|nr:hypothetical protein [Methanomicrobium sp.]
MKNGETADFAVRQSFLIAFSYCSDYCVYLLRYSGDVRIADLVRLVGVLLGALGLVSYLSGFVGYSQVLSVIHGFGRLFSVITGFPLICGLTFEQNLFGLILSASVSPHRMTEGINRHKSGQHRQNQNNGQYTGAV